MKKWFCLILILLFCIPAFADPSVVDKEVLLEKIKLARADIKRMQVKLNQTIDIKDFMKQQSQTVQDIDLVNKVLYSSFEINEFQLNITGAIKGMLEKELNDAKQKGVPAEKIKQIEGQLNGFNAEIEKITGAKIEGTLKKLKGIKSESFVVGQVFYRQIKDKWLSMQLPNAENFWKMYSTAQNPDEKKMILEEVASAHPEISGEAANTLMNILDSISASKDPQAIQSVSEGEFKGQPCYILESGPEFMKSMKTLIDGFMLSVLAKAKNKDSADFKLNYNNFKYKQFVSKVDCLTLGVQLEGNMTGELPDSHLSDLEAKMSVEEEISYPAGQMQLPAGLTQATQVKDAEEMKGMIKSEMKQMFEGMVSEEKKQAL